MHLFFCLAACFYVQIRAWDCSTGPCIETLWVRAMALAPEDNSGRRPRKPAFGRSCILWAQRRIFGRDPGCGPRLHLHSSWATLVVSGAARCQIHRMGLSNIRAPHTALRTQGPASPCPERMALAERIVRAVPRCRPNVTLPEQPTEPCSQDCQGPIPGLNSDG